MDAVKFLKERNRMCDNYNLCTDGCPLFKICDISLGYCREMVAAVEKWSQEHPVVTNGLRFLDDNREYIRTYHRWENGCKPYIEVHIEADWWDDEYKEK